MHRHAHPPPSGSLALPLFLVWRKSCLKTRGPATSVEREGEEEKDSYLCNNGPPMILTESNGKHRDKANAPHALENAEG